MLHQRLCKSLLIYTFCCTTQAIITSKCSSCSFLGEKLAVSRHAVGSVCALIATGAAAWRLKSTHSIKSSLKHIITLYFMHQRQCQRLISKQRIDRGNYHRVTPKKWISSKSCNTNTQTTRQYGCVPAKEERL